MANKLVIITVLEWLAMSMVLLANYLNAHELSNANLVFMLANFLYIFLGVLWEKYSIVVMSFIMLVMYLIV